MSIITNAIKNNNSADAEILNELYDFPLFKGCGLDCIKNFIRYKEEQHITYDSDDYILLPGHPLKQLLLLCEGSVSVNIAGNDGKEFTIEKIAAPKIILPEFIFSNRQNMPFIIKSITSSRIWKFSKDIFFDALHNNIHLLHNFLRITSERSISLAQRVNDGNMNKIYSRIIAYVKRHEKIIDTKEMAEIIGGTPSLISRVLETMLEQGVMKKESDGYILLNEV